MKQDFQKTSDSLENVFDSLFESYKDSEVDNKAIVEKTLAKIRHERIHRRLQIWWMSSLSLAASIFIGFAIYYFVGVSEKMVEPDLRRLADCMFVNRGEVEDIMLITSKKQLQLSENVFVQYDDQGTVKVDGEQVGEDNSQDKLDNAGLYNQLIVPAGKRARLQLADGTRLVLNAMSRVVYPREFKGEERRIYAEGEVYLEVAPDKTHPFVVESTEFDLRVLGTKFNISTYKKLSEVQIVLIEGSVEVTGAEKQKAVLKPNELLSLENGQIIGHRFVDAVDYISWTKGWLHLKGETLSDIMNRLSIHYGVDIVCNTSFKYKRLYGKLELKKQYEDVLNCIQQIVPLKVYYNENKVELRDN
jgi:transmembrane sensor